MKIQRYDMIVDYELGCDCCMEPKKNGNYVLFDDIDSLLREREEMVNDLPSDLIPDNWLDPLLTGKEKVISEPPFECPDIERLLLEIKKRVREWESKHLKNARITGEVEK